MQTPPTIKKLLTLALCCAGTVLALGTPAGTVIQNVATLEFTGDDGTPVVTPGNPVTTTVQAVCRPSVLPNGTVAEPGQSLGLYPGESGLLRYTLTNTGNASNTFALSALADAASQFTPTGVGIYRDQNGNGVVDSGEAAITQITLDADASAALLVRADTAASARGNAYLNLIAACAGNTTGSADERDDNNIGRLTLNEPAAFSLTKTFTPDVLSPGNQTAVNLLGTNAGGTSQPVTVTDFLNTPEMRDFVFVIGSARATGSTTTPAPFVEFTADGSTWSTTEPGTVAGVRVRAPNVAAGGTLGLTFALRATDAALGTHRNTAQLVSGAQTVDAAADVTVKYFPLIALGPIGNPQALPGGELSSDDRQTRSVAFINQLVCFSHTVKNLGDRDDTITTTGQVDTGAAQISFRDPSGNDLASPFQITLAPQATADFQACYLPSQPGGPTEALKVTLTSASSRGAADNKTVDVVNKVEEQKVTLVKSGDKGNGLVAPGDEITYTLKVTNDQDVPLNNVVVRDDLNVILRTCLAPTSVGGKPGAPVAQSVGTAPISTSSTTGSPVGAQAGLYSTLEFISADQGGVLEGTAVVWRFATVQPGQTLSLTLRVRVPAGTPDCASINNLFTLTSDELTEPLPSNVVTNVVFNPDNLRLVKTSTPSTVVIGEEITYIFTVTNNSATQPLTEIKVEDTLPAGLSYVQGSSTLDGAAITPVIDPANARHFTWTVPGLAAGATSEIRFRALVTPDAPATLQNNAVATAVASGRETKTPVSSASNKIQPLSFGPNNADIVGYVFTDVNRNGVYDYRTDLPIKNARVILANGRIELTDAQGRYHFRNVREAEWALRLDPASVGGQSLSVPQDAGLSGSRLVYVRNLTSVDFPLAPDAGDIAVIRDTTLTMRGGPAGAQNTLVVRKQVFATSGDPTLYTVQLTLDASRALNALTLTDPLPTGAALVSGQNTLTIDPLPGGTRTVSYQFRWAGDVKGAVTDPTASWRY